MKNRIAPRVVQKNQKKVVETNRSGDIVFTFLSDGTGRLTVYGKTNERLSTIAKREGTTVEKILRRIITADRINRAAIIARSRKAVAA